VYFFIFGLPAMQPQTHAKPFYIFFLVLPYGISAGFVTVTLPYLLTLKGFSVELAAGIVALGFSANIWRFLWGPVADMTFSLRRWYWIGVIASITTLFLLCLIPYTTKSAFYISLIAFISQVAATLILLPVGGFMAHRILEQQKGRASGWFQAGNLGGIGLGGGAGLWLSAHTSIAIAGLVLCICMLACAFTVLILEDVPSDKLKSIKTQVSTMVKDIASMLRIPILLYVVIMLLIPIGTGAASNLWSAVATDWKVSADMVALVTGIISGLISALGCIAGGWLADKYGVWWAYFGACTISALVTLLMAAGPYLPWMYISGVLVYGFALGMVNSSFSAVALFATGKRAAATRYSLLSSIANLPVVVMTGFDGWAHDHGGSKYMLVLEALSGLFFVIICVVVLAWMKNRNLAHRPADV
jgi:MFS family permease